MKMRRMVFVALLLASWLAAAPRLLAQAPAGAKRLQRGRASRRARPEAARRGPAGKTSSANPFPRIRARFR